MGGRTKNWNKLHRDIQSTEGRTARREEYELAQAATEYQVKQKIEWESDTYLVQTIVNHAEFSKLSEKDQKWYVDSLAWLLAHRDRRMRADFRASADRTLNKLSVLARGETLHHNSTARSGHLSKEVKRRLTSRNTFQHAVEVTTKASPWTRDASLLPKAPPGRGNKT